MYSFPKNEQNNLTVMNLIHLTVSCIDCSLSMTILNKNSLNHPGGFVSFFPECSAQIGLHKQLAYGGRVELGGYGCGGVHALSVS